MIKEFDEKFLSYSENFIKEFESKFINYFIEITQKYEKSFSEDDVKEFSKYIYNDIFNKNKTNTESKEEFFQSFTKDTVPIELLVSKSILFIIDNYNKKMHSKHLGQMVLHVTNYLDSFEKKICIKEDTNKISHFNFDALDNHSAGSNILNTFQNIKSANKEITFFNLYDGVPIKHSATILDIKESGEVTFKTVKTQEIAMELDGVAYILKDDKIENYIKADIVYSDYSNGHIILKNFIYLLSMPATQRTSVRVHPDILVDIYMKPEYGLSVEGKLYDLSVGGLGIISSEKNNIEVDSKVELNFFLDMFDLHAPTKVQINAEVVNIIEYGNSYRYCLKIYPDLATKDKIAKHVHSREISIVKQLEERSKKYLE